MFLRTPFIAQSSLFEGVVGGWKQRTTSLFQSSQPASVSGFPLEPPEPGLVHDVPQSVPVQQAVYVRAVVAERARHQDDLALAPGDHLRQDDATLVLGKAREGAGVAPLSWGCHCEVTGVGSCSVWRGCVLGQRSAAS